MFQFESLRWVKLFAVVPSRLFHVRMTRVCTGDSLRRWQPEKIYAVVHLQECQLRQMVSCTQSTILAIGIAYLLIREHKEVDPFLSFLLLLGCSRDFTPTTLRPST